ncbi:GNAT family N-acetyltransferase [Methanosarcina hadiensis]|uniref:GNAT family N-acetyltransferase n=1 Tax=Methanosarcina hadiensis TaxID=3078083 RepID=UPI003977332E
MEKEPEPLMEIKWIDAKEDKDLKDANDLKDAFFVRREVFIKEQNVPEEEEFDEADPESHHVVIYADGKPVATGRLFKTEESWLIGRIAVLKDYRGKHAGKLVVEKLLEKASEMGAEEIHVHAQTHATNFYRKSGFVEYGTTFQESGIEHISMIKRL